MPECDNCGGHISRDFQRVFSVDGEITVCPSCPDETREAVARQGESQ